MSGGQLFGRNVKVRVYATVFTEDNVFGLPVPQISYNSGYTEFYSVQDDGTPGFRIRGKITQVMPTVAFNTNQITLSIYNLGPNSRSIIQSKVGTQIEIFAGYGSNPIKIGSGNILWARTHKEGPDYITDIIAGDSQTALINGTMNTSFKGATTYSQVIDAILASLANQGIAQGKISGIPEGGYNNGIVLVRSPLTELFDICQKLSLYVNVVDGLVNIFPVGSSNGSPIVEVSESTGMIGIPEVQPPGVIGPQDPTALLAASQQNNITFTSLLRPELSLGQTVSVISKFIKGQYIIASVIKDFDSWEGPFFSKCEAFIHKMQAS